MVTNFLELFFCKSALQNDTQNTKSCDDSGILGSLNLDPLLVWLV